MVHRFRDVPYIGPTKGVIKTTHVDIGDSRNSGSYETSDLNLSLPPYLSGGQSTDSESHPDWNDTREGVFLKDVGGPFNTMRWWAELSNSTQSTFKHAVTSGHNQGYPSGRYIDELVYKGPILPCHPSIMPWPSWHQSSSKELDELGTTAIARSSPSNPSVDLAVAVGELFKEGIPKTIGATLHEFRGLSNRKRRRAIGEEYLNYEFGWKPLVNDLLSFCSAVVDADSTFSRYERDSRRPVRRRYDFPVIRETGIEIFRGGVSPWMNPSSNFFYTPLLNTGQVYLTRTRETRRWFSGSFAYYVPPAKGLRNQMARAVIQARKTFGISLTPDTLWNLAPWSWGVDWFSNTGDVLSNWTDWAIDNQVLLYGYMMETNVFRNTFTFVGETGIVNCPPPPDVILSVVTKTRRRATPYGFGLSYDDFSSRQKAIIAALGISRSR
uniref:Uncharacterized protein n=1 Tax=Leviviridae sp. TaxID=2027243 RepID=A0A514DD66_9VIRU|nr:MAG: hypothetical protein H1BulkLitter4169_000003 [Leviviridae sp.]